MSDKPSGLTWEVYGSYVELTNHSNGNVILIHESELQKMLQKISDTFDACVRAG